MTTTETITLFTAFGSGAGVLIGFGIAWGATRAGLQSLGGLKKEFGAHKDNTEIHIDPNRDPATLSAITALLERIDKRCENRGQVCAEHFSRVEQKIAAATGRIHGND